MNDNIKFWTFLAAIILGVAVGITLIDLTIKAAILQESNDLKRLIWGEEERHESGTEGSISGGIDVDPALNFGIPADLLDTNASGLETGNVSNGDSPKIRRRQTRPRAGGMDRNRDTEIPPAD